MMLTAGVAGLALLMPTTYTYDVPPGDYDVKVVLGNIQEPAEVLAEARRLMVSNSSDHVLRFTVNVRDPEGQQNGFGGPGTPGLQLTATGAERITVTPASRRTQRLFLAGDSTVTDQETAPYTGWGQRLPRHFRQGLSVVNHSGSGESSGSFLEKPELWGAMRPQLRPGDVVLVQFGHNDKQTTAEQFRANLIEIVSGIRTTGATPVLVTPIVRRWFTGTKLNSTGLIVNGLGVDLPAEMRAVAASECTQLIDLTARTQAVVEGLGPEEAEALYLTREKRDDTDTSEYGATVFSDLVATDLRGLGLVTNRYWRSTA
ncbi:lysophospholipase L1-like esterase [Kribbella steppae]|uniref:Lysophospholipase L1-like esterase n=1 Tax=Kribbella steppae TaxID=2512223 RepID=A0A4R2HQC5_9ACTN|nr:GDSL-type esterase/lipase family protein [Kribbella steppae]TCO32678.1 lysophospholipase L1-like esterase [Kribbella steppae]